MSAKLEVTGSISIGTHSVKGMGNHSGMYLGDNSHDKIRISHGENCSS